MQKSDSQTVRQRLGAAVVNGEWLILLVMLPFVVFPSPGRALVLLVIPVLWLLRKWTTGQFFQKTPVDWPVWGLAFMVLVSVWITSDWQNSLPKVVGLLYGLSLFYVVAAFAQSSPRRFWWGTGALLFCGLIVAGLGLLGVRWTQKFPWLDAILARLPERLISLPGAGSGISPNELAGVLLWIVPVGLALCWALLPPRRLSTVIGTVWQRRLIIAFVFGTTAVLLGLMLLAQSRAGLLGLVAGITVMAVIFAGRYRRWLVVGLLVVILAGAAVVLLSDEAGRTAVLEEDLGFRSDGAAANIETVQGRLEIWERALAGIQEFALTGMGMNMFRVLVFDYYPTFFLPRDADFAHAHNQLLQTALDLGLPGLICYLALWLGLALMLYRTWQQTNSRWLRAAAAGFAGALAAYFVYGLVDAVALGARPGFIFWLLLGLIAALHGQVAGAAHADNGS